MKTFFMILGLVLTSSVAFAGKNVSVMIDGETYSCTSGGSSGASCECKAGTDGYTYFYVNGVQAKWWSGTGGNQMVDCANHLEGQSICKTSFVRCNCKAGTDGYTYFYVNGVQAKWWSGTGGTQMVDCAEYQNQQNYCK